MATKGRSDKMPRCRYNVGGTTTVTNSKLGWWEKAVWPPSDTDIAVTISPKYEHSPSKMAYDFYGDSKLDWVILQNNNILDVQTEFVVGAVVKIPSKTRVFTEILAKVTT